MPRLMNVTIKTKIKQNPHTWVLPSVTNEYLISYFITVHVFIALIQIYHALAYSVQKIAFNERNDVK